MCSAKSISNSHITLLKMQFMWKPDLLKQTKTDKTKQKSENTKSN